MIGTWTAGACSCRGCPMTLVMYIGGGQWVCWIHALVLGINPDGERKGGSR